MPDWQSTCYTTNGKYVFHIFCTISRLPMHILNLGNVACSGHRLCECNTIWAESMTVNECYRDGCTGLIKCKYLKVCKQMYKFTSCTRVGAGCMMLTKLLQLSKWSMSLHMRYGTSLHNYRCIATWHKGWGNAHWCVPAFIWVLPSVRLELSKTTRCFCLLTL